MENQPVVFKSNDLVREARYDLTTNEQKLVLWAISKIKPEDVEFEEYKISKKEFCMLLGVDENTQNKRHLFEVMKKIAKKSFDLEQEDGTLSVVHWFITADANDKELSVRFHPKMKPHLLQLSQKFTAYELQTIVQMKSKYSIRIYELTKSYAWKGECRMSVEEMKDWLQCAEYADYNNFKRRVLDVAVSEINAVSDLIIDFKPVRTGRRITDIVFIIEQNPFYGREMA